MYRNQVVTIAAAVALIATLVSGCKKETTEPDDPNIVYYNLQKSMDGVKGGVVRDSVDLNQDGLNELRIELALASGGADTGAVLFSQKSQDIQFAISKISPVPIAATFEKGSTPTLTGSSYTTALYTTFKVSGYREGLLSGEGYLAFRFTTGTRYQYGWMRVSINSGLTQFKILEYAYSLTPDKAIAAGAK